jgi:hypothetical protein
LRDCMQTVRECNSFFFVTVYYSRQYMKANKINYSHLNVARRAFLDVDENGEKMGLITKREFLMKIAEDGFVLPLEFLIYFTQDI